MSSAFESPQPDPTLPAPAVRLSPQGLTIEDVLSVARHHIPLHVTTEIENTVAASRAVVDRALKRGDTVYGLNTHLGHRRNESVDADELWLYQDFVIATHNAGIGAPLSDIETRAVLTSRVAGMARGGSGVSPAVFQLLVKMIQHDVLPIIPGIGSVGAADITQLAAVAEVVTGRGFAIYQGRKMPAIEALSSAGLKPAVLQPKDALAIISANAVSVGLAVLTIEESEHIANLANLAGALTIEATSANISPFTAIAAGSKSFAGQAHVATRIRRMLKGSRLEDWKNAKSVQDALSIRTIPQVHGALLDQLAFTRNSVETELNAAADNPVVSFTEDTLISNGNFAPITMALAFESLRLALAHVGLLSERRLHKLLAVRHAYQSANRVAVSGRIPNLVVNAAAALTAQLRHVAQQVTLNGTTLNLDVEDHTSLAPQTVSLTREALRILEDLLVIEISLAADTMTLLNPEARLGSGTEAAMNDISHLFSSDQLAPAAEVIENVRIAMRNIDL